MEKLFLTNRTNIVQTFEYGDYLIDVESDVERNESYFWLWHKGLSTKEMVAHIPNSYFGSCDICTSTMKSFLIDGIDNAINDYLEIYGGDLDCDGCMHDKCKHCLYE